MRKGGQILARYGSVGVGGIFAQQEVQLALDGVEILERESCRCGDIVNRGQTLMVERMDPADRLQSILVLMGSVLRVCQS